MPTSYPISAFYSMYASYPIPISYPKKQKEEEKKKRRKWKIRTMYDRIFSLTRSAAKRVDSNQCKVNMMLWEPSAAIQKEKNEEEQKMDNTNMG